MTQQEKDPEMVWTEVKSWQRPKSPVKEWLKTSHKIPAMKYRVVIRQRAYLLNYIHWKDACLEKYSKYIVGNEKASCPTK